MGRFKTFDQFLDLFPTEPRQMIEHGYNVLCPAHNDRNPSLSITLNGYRILLHCKAGCPTPQILAVLDLSERDLFLPDSEKHTREATYAYQDASGQLLFEVIRYSPKRFKVRRPDGSGGWIWNLKGVKPVLYHLPDVIDAISTGDRIHITEGEKDCDNLWAIGLVATTNPFGAGKWREEHSESLARGNIVVVPDNDDEGRRHAISVLNSLEGRAKSLQVLEIPSTAKDVSEWLKQGHNQDDLLSLMKITPNVYKSVSDCGLDADPGSKRTINAQKTHKFGVEDIREFVHSHGFRYWEVRHLDYELDISSAEEKHYRRRLLSYLGHEKKEIEQHPTDGKKYRQISQNDVINYKAVGLGNPLDLWLPFDIHKHVNVYPGSLVDFAGVTDSGKTALAVNIIKNNDQAWIIDYWTNELSAEELNERLQQIEPDKPIEDWEFTARVIEPGYLQKIRPGILSIFDYIDVGDPYYRIAEEQQAIHDAIGRGIAVIFMQKDESQTLGRGKGFSAQLPRVYVSMSAKSAYAYKAKTPKNPEDPLKGKSCEFKLRGGVHFEFTGWRYKSD